MHEKPTNKASQSRVKIKDTKETARRCLRLLIYVYKYIKRNNNCKRSKISAQAQASTTTNNRDYSEHGRMVDSTMTYYFQHFKVYKSATILFH